MATADISGSTASPASQTQSGTGRNGLNGEAKLAEDFDTFLGLLVTQLKNQDPLDPMKANEFTNQLVQFSSVEQAIATNSKLDKLLELQSGNLASQAVSYIGKGIEASGDRIVLQNGKAEFSYTLEDSAESAIVQISNDSGQIVRTLPVETSAGRHDVTWDGTDDDGATLPDGTYSIQVQAVDSKNNTIKAETSIRGTVTGVELLDNAVKLNLGPLGVELDQVKAILEPEDSNA